MILLDTHVLIWLGHNPGRLSQIATAAIQKARADDGLAISSLSLFEIAQLVSRGRLRIGPRLEHFLIDLETRFVVKQINSQVALLSSQFTDPYPRDPIDRIIGATALSEGMPLVTADGPIRLSGQLQTIW